MNTKNRGFSLVEMMVATAISAIIAAAAISAVAMVFRHIRTVEMRAMADAEAKLITDVLMSRVQQSGGGTLRPFQSIIVEGQGCPATTVGTITLPPCGGSDRIHLLLPDTDVANNACGITSVSGVNVRSTGSGGTCCMEPGTNLFENRNVVLVSANGEWRNGFCSNVNPTTCECTMAVGQSAYNTPGSDDSVFVGGNIVLGAAQTIFRDPATDRLMLLTDPDRDGDPDLAELADRVHDLQAEYGFDTDGNNRVDVYAESIPATVNREALRSMRLGIIVGVPTPTRDTPSSAHVLNGNTVTVARGVYLRPFVQKAVLRNLLLFN